MKANAHVTIGLSPSNDPPRAVPIRSGTGCNLWIGSLCITAHSAAQFRELAAVATAAAEIQEEAERRMLLPHAYRVASALADSGIAPPAAGWTCELCDHLKEHEIHTAAERSASELDAHRVAVEQVVGRRDI
jgi:hypothetical protein